jgi:cytochrome P450
MTQPAPLPPGRLGLPFLGESLAFMRSPFLFLDERKSRYGNVFKSRVLGRDIVFLAGLEAAEAFYDPENISRSDAHPAPLVDLFGGTNFEMYDGPKHLALKSIAISAFDAAAIAAWLPDIERLTETALARMAAAGEVAATVEFRRLVVEEIALNVMGIAPGATTAAMARDCATTLIGIVSTPVAAPGFAYARARAARDRLLALIRATIAERRPKPGNDALSRMLSARSPDGRSFSDAEAVLEIQHILLGGFIVFSLMAETMRRLAEQPRLRERCAAEISAHAAAGPLSVAALSRLTTTMNVILEAKRLVPLVPLAFGRALRTFPFGGFRIPAGWAVYLALWLNNRDPAVFADPETFDADRFAAPRAEQDKHRLAFIPQGAGPRTGHQCLGLDYSTILVLVLLTHLVRGYRWELPQQSLETDWRQLPPAPREGMRVRVSSGSPEQRAATPR